RPSISVWADNKGLLLFQSGPNMSVWSGSTVDGPQESGANTGTFSSLAFFPSGERAIAYSSSAAAPNDETASTKYAYSDVAEWQLHTVGLGGNWNSLVVDPSGRPTISYSQCIDSAKGHHAVMFAVGTTPGTSWDVKQVADWAWAPSMALTPAGEPAISYYSTLDASIKYAVFTGGGWKYFTVETSPDNEEHFNYPSLAFNPLTGQPTIAYYHHLEDTVKCAIGTVS